MKELFTRAKVRRKIPQLSLTCAVSNQEWTKADIASSHTLSRNLLLTSRTSLHTTQQSTVRASIQQSNFLQPTSIAPSNILPSLLPNLPLIDRSQIRYNHSSTRKKSRKQSSKTNSRRRPVRKKTSATAATSAFSSNQSYDAFPATTKSRNSTVDIKKKKKNNKQNIHSDEIGDDITSTSTIIKPHRMILFQEKEQEFCQLIAKYRDIWYPNTNAKIKENNSSNIPTNWKSAIQFQHPSISQTLLISWDKIQQSEILFRQLCFIQHELFVAVSSLAEYPLPSTLSSLILPDRKNSNGKDTTLDSYDGSDDTDHNIYNENADHNMDSHYSNQVMIEVTSNLLPFWESMRKERTAIVNYCQPKPTTEATDIEENYVQDSSTNKRDWIGWIKDIITETLGGENVTKNHIDIPITAHEDPECAPSYYHYNKVIGRMYFHYLPAHTRQEQSICIGDDSHDDELLEDDGWSTELSIGNETSFSEPNLSWKERTQNRKFWRQLLEERASKIQRIVDLAPMKRVLSDKSIRLSVRSYVDIGTLDACHKAERVYNRFPNARKNLMWHILNSYLNVVKEHTNGSPFLDNIDDSIDDSKPSSKGQSSSQRNQESGLSPPSKIASLATRRIYELVASKHSKYYNEFQVGSVVAFEALACLAPHSDAIEGYHDRVRSLGILKFGPRVWEALIQTKDTKKTSSTNDLATTKSCEQVDFTQSLHPKDYKTLHSLILIYGQDVDYLHRALHLTEVSFDVFPTSELRKSLKRGTFHKLFKTLLQRHQKRIVEETKQKDQGADKPSLPSNPELDVALQLLNKMMLDDIWFPNADTFTTLFQLAENSGPDSDRILAVLEVVYFLSSKQAEEGDDKLSSLPIYPYSPIDAAIQAIVAWSRTAMQNGGEVPSGEQDPAVRAWEILYGLEVSSTPLFMPIEEVLHAYEPKRTPTKAVYALVTKLCSRVKTKEALDVALRVLDIVHDKRLLLESSTCVSILKTISHCPDMDRRIELTKDLFQRAKKQDRPMNKACRRTFRRKLNFIQTMHPNLYEKYHLDELKLELSIGISDENDKDDGSDNSSEDDNVQKAS